MTSYIILRDRHLWNNIITDAAHPLYDLLPPQRSRFLRSRGHDFICHEWEPRGSSDALLTDAYLTLFKSILIV